jgi:hypothetical protein
LLKPNIDASLWRPLEEKMRPLVPLFPVNFWSRARPAPRRSTCSSRADCYIASSRWNNWVVPAVLSADLLKVTGQMRQQ